MCPQVSKGQCYRPLPPTQAPIDPPYQTACQLQHGRQASSPGPPLVVPGPAGAGSPPPEDANSCSRLSYCSPLQGPLQTENSSAAGHS